MTDVPETGARKMELIYKKMAPVSGWCVIGITQGSLTQQLHVLASLEQV